MAVGGTSNAHVVKYVEVRTGRGGPRRWRASSMGINALQRRHALRSPRINAQTGRRFRDEGRGARFTGSLTHGGDGRQRRARQHVPYEWPCPLGRNWTMLIGEQQT